MRVRQRLQKRTPDNLEDGDVEAGTQGYRQERDYRHERAFAPLPQAPAHVLPKLVEPTPVIRFMKPFFHRGKIPQSATGGKGGFFLAPAFLPQAVRFYCQMCSNLFGKVLGAAPTLPHD
jgi:hypothetical protein